MENETVIKTPNNTPPINLKRNEFGLIEHINYVFCENGMVDWRKMVNSNYLSANQSYKDELTKLLNKPFEEIKISEITDDKYLLIKLAGIKDLAQLRGYSSVEHEVIALSSDYILSKCRIEWIPNFETFGKGVIFTALADATPNNCFDFTKNYLAAIAENRAFVRAVRNFLGIHIVGNDEIGPSENNKSNANKVGPHKLLKEILVKKGKSFEELRNQLVTKQYEGAENWEKIEDIPKDKVFEIIEKIKSKSKPTE